MVLVLVTSVASLVGVWLLSFIVEALRRVPDTPQGLRWAPDLTVRYADLGEYKVRYVKAGSGPNLLLLHTLRTQLDLFQKVIPKLADSFTVYAFDYPGHGYSDIPKARYDADFFANAAEKFIDCLNLEGVTAVGVSIGGVIALMLAGRRNPRVAHVIAVNPYDYAKGSGMARSGFWGWITMLTAKIPVVGETVMRLRNFPITKAILLGGVASPNSFPPELLREMNDVGSRLSHYRAFVRLLRNSASWEAAAQIYRSINLPVRLLWAEKDWSRPNEREHDRTIIPGAQMVTIANGGHFLPLDRPDAVIAEILSSLQAEG